MRGPESFINSIFVFLKIEGFGREEEGRRAMLLIILLIKFETIIFIFILKYQNCPYLHFFTQINLVYFIHNNSFNIRWIIIKDLGTSHKTRCLS
jgi:hypothetical protein